MPGAGQGRGQKKFGNLSEKFLKRFLRWPIFRLIQDVTPARTQLKGSSRILAAES
jgi:hypothetical protein